MNIPTLLTTLSLTCATTGFGATIIYTFQDVPAGPLPGGFLSLTVGGVNAFFSAAGTTVDVDPATSTHVLRTGNYRSQMGIYFSAPVREITIGISGNIPTTSNFVSSFAYYGADYGLYGMPTVSSSGSTLIFNVPGNFPEVRGLLLDGNSGNGYALTYVSIQLVPEPTPAELFVLGIAGVLVWRVKKYKGM